jgi:chemotaxis protein methyltransferase WspC
MAGPFEPIEALITGRIGLDPAAVGSSLIPRAVRIRMRELGLHDLDAYTALARSSEAELQALIEHVVVSESWFLRDLVPFRNFQAHVRTGWVAKPQRPPLRVLSIPCAGGEEPYSIAIALLEVGLDAQRSEIHAVDISAQRLEAARHGVFSSNAFRGGDLAFRDRYFHPHPHGFEVNDAVRAPVRFHQGSILDPRLLYDQPAFDGVFCRNLLIYLDDASRAKALRTLDHLLAASGVLIIGHADRVDNVTGVNLFTQFGEMGAFTYCKVGALAAGGSAVSSAGGAQPWPPRQKATSKLPEPPATAPPQSPASILGSRVATAAEQRLGEGFPVDALLQGPGSVKAHIAAGSEALLEQAAELANRGRPSEAVKVCEQAIRQQGPSAAAFYLMGMIHQSAGNPSWAEECFQKAIYLDPAHDEALLALALSAERHGNVRLSASFRRRAERAILRRGVP